MAPDERPGPEDPDPAGGPPPPTSTEDTLRALEQRLGRASEAAERLLAEAARAAATRVAEAVGAEPVGADDAVGEAQERHPPPAGWQVRGADPGSGGRGEAEVETLVAVVRSLRELIPPELQRRLAEAVRELLLAVRALIDWYLERLERRRAAPAQVQDIPIL